ncbi:MAG: vWA domain-containing protein [bacterium]
MRFYYPYWLLLLLIVPFMVFWYRKKGKGRASLRFSNIETIKQIRPSRSLRYRHIIMVFKMTAIVLIILALARPQSGERNREITAEGIGIMLAMDVSGSMQAEDFKPNNRLYVAKRVVADFIKGREADQIGMVVFAGRSFTQCPLTLDYGILISLLDKVEIGMIEDGTAIGMALANCVNRLKDVQAKSKVIVLLTDGQNNKGEIDPLTAAKVAQAMKIKVYTVGVGKEGGAPIPVYDPFLGKVYARGPDGRLILTHMDEGTLKEIASITGGRYFRATDPDSLHEIYRQIDRLEKTKVEIKQYMEYSDLFQYLLIPAIFLLLLCILLENTRFMTVP